MKQIIIIFLILSFLQSCQRNNGENDTVNYFDSSIIVDSLNFPLDSNQMYFPYHLFADTSLYIGRDTFLVNWYSSHLRAMTEPLLFNKNLEKEVYRFLWLRTFDNPISIRIEKENSKYTLTWKLCDGAGGYYPGKMTINKAKSIDKKTWDQFHTLIKKSDFWHLPTTDVEFPGTDGSEWILEGFENKNYHVVDRWTPRGGKFYYCCNFLINLTDLTINEKDKY